MASLRPEDVPGLRGANERVTLEGTVKSATYLGESSRYSVRVAGGESPFVVDAPDEERTRRYDA